MFLLQLITGVVPIAAALISAFLSVRWAIRTRDPLQIAVAGLVLLLVGSAVNVLRQIAWEGFYPTYAPYIFIVIAAVLTGSQWLSVRNGKRE